MCQFRKLSRVNGIAADRHHPHFHLKWGAGSPTSTLPSSQKLLWPWLGRAERDVSDGPPLCPQAHKASSTGCRVPMLGWCFQGSCWSFPCQECTYSRTWKNTFNVIGEKWKWTKIPLTLIMDVVIHILAKRLGSASQWMLQGPLWEKKGTLTEEATGQGEEQLSTIQPQHGAERGQPFPKLNGLRFKMLVNRDF